MDKRKIDHFLLGAIRKEIGMPSVRYDLTRIKKLERFDFPVDTACFNPVEWLLVEAGDYDLIGDMPNLHTLLFSQAQPFERQALGRLRVNDFSFLRRCKKLKRLDVSATNFSDCRLLLELPALKSAVLPPRSQLTYPEVLEQGGLSAKVRVTPEPTIPVRDVKPPEPERPQFIPMPPGGEADIVLPKPDWRNPKPAPQAAAKPTPKAGAAAEPLQSWNEEAARSREVKKAPNAMIKKLVERYKERTAQKAYSLTIQPEAAPTLFDSKLGGLPYWPQDKPVPVDRSGNPMMLLAQVNFDEAPTAAPLPTKGMLQFFIPQDDDTFGASFGEGQGNFRVVYHETIDRSATREQVAALGIPDSADEAYAYFTPVFRECVLKVEAAESYMPLITDGADAIAKDIARELGMELPNKPLYQALTRGERDYLWDNVPEGRHWMLGYPYFTQYDPRDENSPYDTLLLQIDTDGAGKADYVMWGDAGVGNFFINHEKLERLDFSDVLYTWDCC